jgi:methionine-rich copper-binding protein CopC
MKLVHRLTRTVAQTVVAVSFVGVASLAYAHAFPKVRTPAPQTTVVPPHEVSIEFSEALEPAFSSITVTDAHGNSVGTARSAVDANDHTRMSVAVGDLAPGAYTVAWVAVAEDGHRTQGHYVFNVK